VTVRIEQLGMSLSECGGCGCGQCGGNPDAEMCTCSYPTAAEPYGHLCIIPPKGFFCKDMSEMEGIVVNRDMSDALIHVRPSAPPPPPHYTHTSQTHTPIIQISAHPAHSRQSPCVESCQCFLRNRIVCVRSPSWCQGAPRSPPSARPSQTPVRPAHLISRARARHAAQLQGARSA
jgi:hypothetical protein